jgi:hypothetical protein
MKQRIASPQIGEKGRDGLPIANLNDRISEAQKQSDVLNKALCIVPHLVRNWLSLPRWGFIDMARTMDSPRLSECLFGWEDAMKKGFRSGMSFNLTLSGLFVIHTLENGMQWSLEAEVQRCREIYSVTLWNAKAK